jgi:hypothetical protein
MSEELEIEISPSGQVTVKTKGIKGPACMDYADLFAQILGREEHRERTAEFYETATEQVQRRVDVKQRR